MDELIKDKLTKLKEILIQTKGVVVAFSGGVDSALLLKVAHEVLGDRAIAITAISEVYPDHELEMAKKIVALLGVKHLILEISELVPEFQENPPERCYYCKKDIFGKLLVEAVKMGITTVVDGTNVDDLQDFRPGMKACKELGIRSPLQEACLTKHEIRVLSKASNLPTWDLPSYACLASRFPYGTPITKAGLSRVGNGENLLRNLGFKQFRLRDHDRIARLEIDLTQLNLLLENRTAIIEGLHTLGYRYITLDLEGYRTGSMNEVLNQ